MSQFEHYDIFLSHNQSQVEWSRSLAARLREEGFRVFFAEDSISLGDDIYRKIEMALGRCKHVLLVLSPEALRSKWVALELSTALHSDPSAAERKVIPILRKDCEMPLSLARLKYLDARTNDLDHHVGALKNALRGRRQAKPYSSRRQSPPDPRANRTCDTDSAGAEEQAIAFDAGGCLPYGARTYINRAEDRNLETVLEYRRRIPIICGPRMCGKSSMLVRALRTMEQRGHRTAYLDLSAIAGREMKTSGFGEIAAYLTRELGIQPGSPTLSWLLQSIDFPAVVAFDEIEVLRGDERNDFFSLLRSFWNHQAYLGCNRVLVIVASVLCPAALIDSPDRSPFNCGERIRLRNFTLAENEALLKMAEEKITASKVAEIFRLTGGQPYLVQKCAIEIQHSPSVSDALIRINSHAFIRDMYFYSLERSLAAGRSINAVAKLLSGTRLNRIEEAELDQLGIIRVADGRQEFIGTLYGKFFSSVVPLPSMFKRLWWYLGGA